MSINTRLLNINSFNCRGLRDQKKRRDIFHWLKSSHYGVTFLQETHCTAKDESNWEKEWGGKIIFSNGSSQSKGVAILIPELFDLDLTVVKETKDEDGRILLIECEIENFKFTLVNIYAPTKDHLEDQIQFWRRLKVMLESNAEMELIVGGDFNTQLNPDTDKKGGRIEYQTQYTKLIESSMDEYNLVDIWRLRNLNDRKFTRREKTRAGLVQSRLDFWLISESLSYQVKNCHIKPGNKSDHSLIKISLEILNTQKRGPGYWKFNNRLLHDSKYINMVKKELKTITKDVTMENKNVLWDFTKCQIRSITITYCKKIAYEKRKTESALKKKLDILDQEMNYNQDKLAEYYETKKEWEHIQSEKSEGIIMRSRVQWAEQGEKNTKYFLNMEKRNYNKRYIKKLETGYGLEITDPSEILNEQKKFYSDLYSSSNLNVRSNNAADKTLSNIPIPKLNNLEKKLCDENLTISEIAMALRELPNDKTPGSDGFTTNFYKFFWSDIRMLLYDSFAYTFSNGSLSDDQRRGIINIIPKDGKDLRFLRNWRPVSLLNTDYKILTKTLSKTAESFTQVNSY